MEEFGYPPKFPNVEIEEEKSVKENGPGLLSYSCDLFVILEYSYGTVFTTRQSVPSLFSIVVLYV